MEKVAVISKKQQYFTLAARKKKPKGTFKNVLAQPFPRYWPQMNDTECKEFFMKLKSIKDVRPDFYDTKKSERPKQIDYGIRSTLQKAKKGKCDIVVLSADLKPRYVINQIILLALAHNESVNIFCVQNVADKMKEFISFPCFAFTISIDVDRFRELDDLLRWCACTKEKSHPVPKVILEYFSLKNGKKQKTDEVEMKELKVKGAGGKSAEPVDLEKLYLVKKAEKSERLFVPENAKDLRPQFSKATVSTFDQSDFISLSSSLSIGENEETLPEEKKIYVPSNQGQSKTMLKRPREAEIVREYRTLTINKIQGNPGKVKKDKKKVKIQFSK